MSGTSDNITCPNCNSNGAYRYEAENPPQLEILCSECGYMVTTQTRYLTLEQLNEFREFNNMEPLSELPIQNLYA